MIAILSWDMYSVSYTQEIDQQQFIDTFKRNGLPQRLKIQGQHLFSGSGLQHDGGNSSQDDTLWPNSAYGVSDRILNQLQFRPKLSLQNNYLKNKLILFYAGLDVVPEGNEKFLSQSCPVTSCYLTDNLTLLADADVIVFQNVVPEEKFFDRFRRPPGQIWIWFALESPIHSEVVHRMR